jgi:imidazolonepropionase-like amidohydrolase
MPLTGQFCVVIALALPGASHIAAQVVAIQAGILIDPESGTEKPSHEAAAPRTDDKYVVRLKRASAAGVNVVFGTDVMSDIKGRTRGEVAMEYVDSFVEAGIGNADILRAIATRAAVLLGVGKERGAIRVGMAADLVASPIDPLHDIAGLKKIDFVMKDGRVRRER